jgi:hypothetical protein
MSNLDAKPLDDLEEWGAQLLSAGETKSCSVVRITFQRCEAIGKEHMNHFRSDAIQV